MKTISFNKLPRDLGIGFIREFLTSDSTEFNEKHIGEIIYRLGIVYFDLDRMNRQAELLLHFWVDNDVGQVGTSFGIQQGGQYNGFGMPNGYGTQQPRANPMRGMSNQALAAMLENFLLTQFRHIVPYQYQTMSIDPLMLMDEIKDRLRSTQFVMPVPQYMAGMCAPVSVFEHPNGMGFGHHGINRGPGYGTQQPTQEQPEDEDYTGLRIIDFGAGVSPEDGVANLSLRVTEWCKQPWVSMGVANMVVRAAAEVSLNLCDREKVTPEAYSKLESLIFYVITEGPKSGEWGVNNKYPGPGREDDGVIITGKLSFG